MSDEQPGPMAHKRMYDFAGLTISSEVAAAYKRSKHFARQQDAKMAALVAALKEYGRHNMECNTQMSWHGTDTCDCGFSAALREVGA